MRVSREDCVLGLVDAAKGGIGSVARGTSADFLTGCLQNTRQLAAELKTSAPGLAPNPAA